MGDISTSIAVLDALNSNRVHQAQLGWSVLSSHRGKERGLGRGVKKGVGRNTPLMKRALFFFVDIDSFSFSPFPLIAIRCKFESSVPYLHFSISSATKTSEYLHLYENALHYLKQRSEEGVYLSNFHRICSYLTSIGSILDPLPSSSSSSSSTSTSSSSFSPPPSPSLSSLGFPHIGALLNECKATAVGEIIVKYGIRGLKKGTGMCFSLFSDFLCDVGGMKKKGEGEVKEKDQEKKEKDKENENDSEKEKEKEKMEKEKEKEERKEWRIIHKKLSLGVLGVVARHFEGGEETIRSSLSSLSLPILLFREEEEGGEGGGYKPKKMSFDARRTGSLMLGGEFRRHSGMKGGGGGGGGGGGAGWKGGEGGGRGNSEIASFRRTPKKGRRGEGEGEGGRGVSPGKRRGLLRQFSLKGEELERGSIDKERRSLVDKEEGKM